MQTSKYQCKPQNTNANHKTQIPTAKFMSENVEKIQTTEKNTIQPYLTLKSP